MGDPIAFEVPVLAGGGGSLRADGMMLAIDGGDGLTLCARLTSGLAHD
jgi:hypothetical protein